jgi:hypothetical protein
MDRVASLVLALALPAIAEAQIPEKFENLQVFPRDVPRPQLVQRMREFSLSLGVRCEHCHTEESPGVSNRYASDARPAKVQARAMLRMVNTINTTLLTQLPSHTTPSVSVECVTCHRGLAIPKTLQTALFETVADKGIAAAIEQYRALRGKEMGSGRYNFGEWEINELARRLNEGTQPDAATAILEMNAEFHPGSAAIDYLLGEQYRAKGERDKALVRYRSALAKAPDHDGARRRVEELETKR